jgi:WD40 repeat protein
MRWGILTAILIANLVGGKSVSAQHHTFRYFTTSGSPIGLHELVVSPDSKWVAISTKDGKTSLVSTADGEIKHQHPLEPFSLNFSGDSTRLLMVSQRGTQLLNLANRQASHVRWQIPLGYLGFALESKNGKLLVKSLTEGGPAATGGDLLVGDELIGITVGSTRRNLLGQTVEAALQALQGPLGSPVTLHVVHAGRAATTNIELVRQRATQVDGKLQFGAPTDAGSSPQVCVSFTEKNFVLLDAASGDVLSLFAPREIQSAGQYAISPDGKYFALVARDLLNSRDMAVELFDVAKQERVTYSPLPYPSFSDAEFSPDGKSFIVASQDRLQIMPLDTRSFAEPFYFSWRPEPVADNQDDESTASQSSPFPETTAGKARAAVEKEVGPVMRRSQLQAPRDLVACFALSVNGVVAIGTPTGCVELWSLRDGSQIAEVFTSDSDRAREVEAIAFSPSGDWLTFYGDGTLHIMKLSERLAGKQ